MTGITDTEAFLAAARAKVRSRGPKCAALRLSEPACVLIEAGLADGLPVTVIVDLLADETVGTGEVIGEDTIRRHFVRRDCKCTR